MAGSPDNGVLLAGHDAGDNKLECLGGFGKGGPSNTAGSRKI